MPRRTDLVDDDEARREFYPFYLIKRRSSIHRSRSSLQSLQSRNKVRLVRRLVRKSGKSSIHQKSSTHRSYHFLLDMSNTLIESSWVWVLLVLSLSFIVTWLTFAGFWAIINIEDAEINGYNGTETCLGGISSFAGYLLFSIETQTSIGYGGRFITEYCPEAVTVLCIQLIVGIGIGGTLTCVVYLKMEGPLKNLHSLVCFSKKAVICQRDGNLCLIFRVRDCDKRHEAQNKIVAYVVEKHTKELSLKLLTLQATGILIWPIDVVHKIDRLSPFWDISAKDLMVQRFEIIVVMEGSSLATSYMSRTTTSYLSREIKWGHKFKQCTTFDKRLRKYKVNHDLFHRTEEVVTPLCSAKRLYEVYDDVLTITSPGTSVYESSKYSSPVMFNNDLRLVRNGTEDHGGRQVVTSVEVHRADDISSCSSDDEPEATFMELSDDNLLAVRRADRSGVAQNLLNSLHKFVPANVRKSWDRNYKETAF